MASVVRGSSHDDAVTVTVINSPAGVIATVSQTRRGSAIDVALDISVGAVTAPGTYPITIQASTWRTPRYTASVSLEVVEQPRACLQAGDAECGQWAVSAKASSEYSATEWSANRATGRATIVGCVDDVEAWATRDEDGVDWLELTYPIPVRPTEIRIYEVFGVGSIEKVEVRDVMGTYHTVYTARPAPASCPRILTIPVAGIFALVDVVRISLDQRPINNWNEIDAVRLIGRP